MRTVNLYLLAFAPAACLVNACFSGAIDRHWSGVAGWFCAFCFSLAPSLAAIRELLRDKVGFEQDAKGQ